MPTSDIATTIKVLEIEDKPMVPTAVPPSRDSKTITLGTFSKLLETAESDLYEKKAFVQTVSKELSKNPPEMSIMLHKLLQRGFLDEILEASDFTVWKMFSLNARVSQAILKFIFSNYAAETSLELCDYVVKLKFNDLHVKQFVNFYAIRNMALKIIDVDACVLLCKQYGVLPELLDNLLLVWSDPTFIESGSVDYHRRISFALASIARIGQSERESHPLDLKRFVPKFLAGIPLYLEAAREIVREMGMIMADTLAQLLTPDTKLNLMRSSSPFFELILKVTKGPPVSKKLGCESLVRQVSPPIIKYETRILPKSEEFLPIAAKDKSPRYE